MAQVYDDPLIDEVRAIRKAISDEFDYDRSSGNMTSREIRQQFLDFFRERGHVIVPSSPVVPLDDPTLLFTNAGMNQFKDVFLGTGSRPYARAADTQKCIRAGGKHNDLDDVGRDTYHHTFFEMLGNWSFGDYFKKEAIEWAWDMLTRVWGIDKGRLHATYFGGDARAGLEPDEEARRLWTTVTDMDPTHVHPGGMKDNFWEMGDTGPCGPCSEIHVDLTPDQSGGGWVNAGDHRVIEIWNLVFIQFNRAPDGQLTPLPAKHVDTGMGFERLCAVLLGKKSNYDTDVFAPLFRAIQKRTGAPDYRGTVPHPQNDPQMVQSYPQITQITQMMQRGESTSSAKSAQSADTSSGQSAQSVDSFSAPSADQVMVDVSYRVIADHLRCLTFAITDGAVPSNEGRGYVLRRILRRAVRYGRQYFNAHEPFLCDLVEPLVAHMGDVFPELRTAHGGRNVERVADLLREEESSFGRTLDRGLRYWWNGAAAALMDAFTSAQKKLPQGRRAIMALSSPVVYEGTEAEEDPIGSLPPEQWHLSIRHPSGEIERFKLTDIDADLVCRLVGGEVTISGGAAFKLHDTYGFPIDLTELMARERGLTVDIGEYERLMEEAREKARQSGKVLANAVLLFGGHVKGFAQTDDLSKYSTDRMTSTVRGILRYGGTAAEVASVSRIGTGDVAALVFDKTCFYAEAGGQAGDTGRVIGPSVRFEVENTQRIGCVVVHLGTLVQGQLVVGQPVELAVDTERRATMQNHTATHLLNWALREVLGDGVQQKGSLVDPEKTRFDFSHRQPLTLDELTRVEELVNEKIAAQIPVYTKDDADLNAARRIKTLRAVFGEKYNDQVRIVSVGANVDEMLERPEDPRWRDHAVELCGGTHLANTGAAERFILVSEEAVAKGVRRVVGITGHAAREAERVGKVLLDRVQVLTSTLHEELAERLAAFQREADEAVIPLRFRHVLRGRIAELEERLKKQHKQQAAACAEAVREHVAALLASAPTVAGVTVVVGEVPAASPDALRSAIDWVRNKTTASAVLLAAIAEGKVTLLAGMSREAVARGLKAGDLIKAVAPLVGGKGGGRPDLAQGGGTNPEALPQVLVQAEAWIAQKLSP